MANKKTKFTYHKNDYFYDVESLENVFTIAFYNPLRELAVICYIDDDNIIKGEKEKKFIEERIYKNNKNFRGTIAWQNLKDRQALYNFVKMMGIADNDTYLNTDERDGLYPFELFPVKMTDPDYNPDVHGLMFGYNSYNYDMTIIAWLMSELNEKWLCNPTEKSYKTFLPSAKELRDFNDELFDSKYKSQMPSRLAAAGKYSKPKDTNYYIQSRNQNHFGAGNNYNSVPWCLRKSWLLTNRYLDVAKLNEKMFKVGLKRLLGMLGYQILESDKLSNDTRIRTLDEMAELIAYNFSDVFNLKLLFEHKEYQNNYKIKNQLLKDYPETIYQKDPSKYAPYTGVNAHLRIRKDRLTTDSTSAKFIEFIISPYGKLKDNRTVSLLYPALPVCEQLTLERREIARKNGMPEEEVMKIKVEQTDILEDTKIWFESNVARIGTPAHKQFMEVYNFYKEIVDKNFNDSPQYREDYGSVETFGNDFVKDCMQKYNTNLFYFDKDGNRTSCIANCSIGGIHGAEIKLKDYEQDYQAYVDQIELQEWVKDQYRTADQPKNLDLSDEDKLVQDNEIALIAINGPRLIDLPNGEQVTIRSFLKSGSTRAKATWKTYKEPELFKRESISGKYKLDKKYTYTSVGPANHEDFTSYYPLLLTRMMAFSNEHRTVNGVPFDPYMAIFEKRYEQKSIAGDESLPINIRNEADLIQNAMKLLLNAASGAGDAKFDNNIRINNKIISMRIIGQLFAWRIGQAQALAGARVPSTNTDGLYTMDISPEENNKILFDIADSMYIGIEPETLDRFVTKDSNNRMEYRYNKWEKKKTIASAKGGTLNSWAGPYPTQNLDHSAAVDRVLAYYLAEHEDPVNQPFDRELAKRLFGDIITEFMQKDELSEALRFFQWILASSINTHRFFCINKINASTGETISNHTIQHYNRIFLTRPTGNVINIPFIATKVKVSTDKANKRERAGELTIQHNAVGYQMLLDNGIDLDTDTSLVGYEATVQKAKIIPNGVNIDIVNEDLTLLPKAEQLTLINRLDANAYIDILESTFYNAWSNIPRPKSDEPEKVKHIA